MKTRLLTLMLAFGLLTAAFAKGADEEVIRDLFASYWKAYSVKDFAGAGKTIFPDDLIEVKKEILPVFLSALENSDTEVQDMAAAFFGSTPEGERSTLSAEGVFECLNRFIVVAAPQFFELLRSSSVTVDRVEISGNNATIYYRIHFQGVSETDTEALLKKGDEWWLRVKEDPKETAKKFRKLFRQ